MKQSDYHRLFAALFFGGIIGWAILGSTSPDPILAPYVLCAWLTYVVYRKLNKQ